MSRIIRRVGVYVLAFSAYTLMSSLLFDDRDASMFIEGFVGLGFFALGECLSRR